MLRKKKLCKCGCGNTGYIWAKGMLKHCYLKYNKPSRIKKVSSKKTQRIASGNGEAVLFRAIWLSRPHVCQVSGEPIHEPTPSNFMHILSKGAYPAFRLYDKNILLVTKEIHHQYDCGNRHLPIFEKVNKLHDQLIQQYYEHDPKQPTAIKG